MNSFPCGEGRIKAKKGVSFHRLVWTQLYIAKTQRSCGAKKEMAYWKTQSANRKIRKFVRKFKDGRPHAAVLRLNTGIDPTLKVLHRNQDYEPARTSTPPPNPCFHSNRWSEQFLSLAACMLRSLIEFRFWKNNMKP